jgi:hypothetical protein
VSRRVEFHDLADVDLFEAWTWYENHQVGLGDRFLSTLNATVHRAARWPHGGEPVLWDNSGAIIERKVPTDGFRTRCATGSSVIGSS